MSRQHEEIKITVNYGDDIQNELRENCHKPHWKDYELIDLYWLMSDEVRELLDELLKQIPDYDLIISESADIGAFCAMISDNARRAKAENLTLINADGKSCSV